MRLQSFLMAVILLTGCSIAGTKKRVQLPDLLRRHAPIEQRFTIDPGKSNYVYGKKGTMIFIPKGAMDLPEEFNPGDIVEVRLVEVTTAMDRLTVGLPLVIDGGLLESAGMFRIRVFWKKRALNLRKGQKFSVSFPDLRSGRKFRTWYLKDGIWKMHGLSLITRAGISDHFAPGMQPAADYDTVARAVPKRFLKIFRFGWWNFDNPEKRFVRIRGTVSGGGKGIQVIALSLRRAGQTMIEILPGRSAYSLRTLPNSRVVVCAVSRDSRAGSVTIATPGFKTGTRPGALQVPEIRLRPVPSSVITNREALRRYLKIPATF